MNSSSYLTSIKFDEIGFSVSIESLIFLYVIKRLKCKFAYAAMSSGRIYLYWSFWLRIIILLILLDCGGISSGSFVVCFSLLSEVERLLILAFYFSFCLLIFESLLIAEACRRAIASGGGSGTPFSPPLFT